MTMNFGGKTANSTPSFLHLEIQPAAEGSKSKEHSPDYWGRSRCYVDLINIVSRLGAGPELMALLNQLCAETGLTAGRVTFSVGGWDDEYSTGTQFIRVTANRFVDADGNLIDEGQAVVAAAAPAATGTDG